MKKVVIGNENLSKLFPHNDTIQNFELNGTSLKVGLINVDMPSFDLSKKGNESKIVIKIKAFSCNYRDKAIIVDFITGVNLRGKVDSEDSFTAIGSDFVGEVIAVGPSVKMFREGDRVISNSSYPFREDGAALGIPSNSVSEEYKMFHYSKLMKIPDEISDVIGAAFTVGSITAYSMVRRLEIQKGDTILITSANANTSIFSMNVLKKYADVSVSVLTTNLCNASKIKESGVDSVIKMNHIGQNLLENEDVRTIIRKQGALFNKVINPFHDLFFSSLVFVMDYFAKYVTCGNYSQINVNDAFNSLNRNSHFQPHIFNLLIGRSVDTIYNCLGLETDLQQAILDYRNGIYSVYVDSVFSNGDVSEFLSRSFNFSADRFGKVVYSF